MKTSFGARSLRAAPRPEVSYIFRAFMASPQRSLGVLYHFRDRDGSCGIARLLAWKPES
jgi:hypothetical protein